jgi:hypothetical protein
MPEYDPFFGTASSVPSNGALQDFETAANIIQR